jgi:flagellar motor switch protein FliN/FliY
VPSDLKAILQLEVPVIVLLGQRPMPLSEVVGLVPGQIVELPKQADEELELLVNNKVVGVGKAVKVGENFGIRLTFVGDVASRVRALAKQAQEAAAAAAAAQAQGTTDPASADADALAEQMLAGQMGQAA